MDLILTAIAEMAQPFRMLMLVTGVFAGLVVGVVPGVGGLFAMALLIPMTYGMDPYAAFALLLGMGSVTTTSDTIPAILFGVPGSVGAAATVLDGHAMAKKGEAARAFGASYSASMIGGVFGALVLALAIPVMRPLVLYLKTPDFFAICAFGLSIVAILAGSQPLKGLAAAMLGMLASFVGIDQIAGVERWSFGQIYLWDGLPVSLVFLGLFGLPELASLLLRGSIQGSAERPSYAGMRQGILDTLREWPLVLRCSAIGSLLGAVPGIGIAVLDWIAYGHASRRPGSGPKFGQGNVRGVIAPESANNAKEGGALIPTIAFGVPGSASMSILLGAFVVHGLVPGPEMLGKNAAITVSMVLSVAVANIVGAVTCLMLTRQLARIAQVSASILVPLVVTSHTWENSKNEQSHQDPTIGEALLGEMSDTARVLFPVDANTAMAALRSVYGGRGQVACLIVSKRDMPHRLEAETATRFVEDGAAHFEGVPDAADLQIVAIGAYQLEEALKAASRLGRHGHRVLVTGICEPGRFRQPRDPIEAAFTAGDDAVAALFPPDLPRVIVTHTRPEPMLGLLRRLDGGPRRTTALGYISRGGTFDVPGMLFANRCSWAHLVDAAAPLAGWSRDDLLTPDERDAINGRGDPAHLLISTT